MNNGSLSAGVETACETIRKAIQSGRFPGGSRITEAEVCNMANVSRSSVRQALTLLAAEGYVELRANKGATVIDWTGAELYEVFDVRAILEGHGCALAARYATAAQVEQLKAEADRFQQLVLAATVDTRAVTESNNRFHQLILDAGRNRRLAAMFSAVIHVPLEQLTFARYNTETFMRSAQQHQELVIAIAAHDPNWAEACMRAHIYAGKQIIFGSQPPVQPPEAAGRRRST